MCLTVLTYAADAVNYVDCSSDAAVGSVKKCMLQYNVADANFSGAACAYYTGVAACIPEGCCNDYDVYKLLEKNNKALGAMGITTCNNRCGGPYSSVTTDVSCDNAKVDDMVRSCGNTAPMDTVANTCAHYLKVASCIPPECCAVPYFVDILKSNKAALDGLGLATCSPVCSPKLAGGVRNVPVVLAILLVSAALGSAAVN